MSDPTKETLTEPTKIDNETERESVASTCESTPNLSTEQLVPKSEDEESAAAGADSTSNSNVATAFVIAQLVFWGALGVYASQRYDAIKDEKRIPQPSVEALKIEPKHNLPEVISDDDLTIVLNKLRPKLRGPRPRINHVDHALRFWGVEAIFPGDEESLSGVELRELLTDHRRFQEAWGDETKAFLLPNTRGSYQQLAFRTRSGQASASHVDHTLAGLAEVGTPLDYPVYTASGELPLRAAFNSMVANFRLNQTEYEWTTLVFLHYFPHVKSWFTREGQRVTWDLLADRLMRQRLAQGVCFGNHRLYTLAVMLRIDETHQLLSDAKRKQVVEHLQDATKRLVAMQNDEGYWDGKWPGDEWDGPQPDQTAQPLGPLANQILATGHAMEWWAIAPAAVHPPTKTLEKAGAWLTQTIKKLSASEVKTYYTFLSHAGRALALWRGKFPAQVEIASSKSKRVEGDNSVPKTPEVSKN